MQNQRHHQFNGCEFEQTSGDGWGQGSLACCSPWHHRQSDMMSNWTTKKQHGQRNDWCGWSCFGNQMICCPHPPPFQAISSAHAPDWQHLRTSFLFSHFLTLAVTSRTSYSLPQLSLTETVVWDTSLHSYRGKRANIFEELTAIEKAFVIIFHDWSKLENTGNLH